MGDLIPGLPDDLASECLIRMHFESFPNAVLTCKKWKHEIGSPDYLHRRIVGGHSQSIVVMTQQGYDSDRKTDIVRLVLCELKTGNWRELPPIPGYFKGFPNLCRLAVVGLNLIVLGGMHCRGFVASNEEVYIYSFVSNTWRRGADMLGFMLGCGCTSDSDRAVYVVGVFDDKKKKPMMSALAYDVEKDEWSRLPDLENEVVNEGGMMKATFLSGKLHVFGAIFWKTDVLKFNMCVQAFDPATSTWSPVTKYLLDVGRMSDPRVEGEVGNVYVCGGGKVAVIENEKCQKVADLPVALHNVKELMTWKKHLVVIGYVMNRARITNMVCLLDLESKEWSILEAPRSYSGLVQFACTSEI